MKSLNGWQRAGIAASVLWLVGVSMYVSMSSRPYVTLYLWYWNGDKELLAAQFIPVLALWLGGYAFAWVKRGFTPTA